MDEAEVVSISGVDGIDRIYPPKEFWERIIASIHRGGKHFAIVFTTCSQHYRWPQMRVDIKIHISNCKTCFKNNPATLRLSTPV